MQLDTSYFFAVSGGPSSKTTLRFSFQTLPDDSTFGWNGKISGMSVYYSQYLDSRITIDKESWDTLYRGGGVNNPETWDPKSFSEVELLVL